MTARCQQMAMWRSIFLFIFTGVFHALRFFSLDYFFFFFVLVKLSCRLRSGDLFLVWRSFPRFFPFNLVWRLWRDVRAEFWRWNMTALVSLDAVDISVADHRSFRASAILTRHKLCVSFTYQVLQFFFEGVRLLQVHNLDKFLLFHEELLLFLSS